MLERYLARGVGGLEGIIGDWSLALWDGSSRSLVLACDPNGGRAVLWRRDGERVVAATTSEQLVPNPRSEHLDDAVVLWYLYGGGKPAGDRTFFGAVRRVPSGQAVIVRPGGSTRHPLWRWPDEPPPPRRVNGDDAARFRDLVFEATRCRLPTEEPISVLLSGGVDSSIVAGVANRLAREDGRLPVRAYTSLFDRTPGADERGFCDAVVQQHGLGQVTALADEGWTLSNLERWLPWFHEPYSDPYEPTHDALLERVRSDGITSLLWGHGGDSLLMGQPGYLAGWAIRGRLLEVHRQLRARQRVLRSSYARRVAGEVVAPLLPASLRRAVWPSEGPGAEVWRPPQVTARLARDPLPVGHTGPDGWWYDLRHHLLDSSQSPFAGHVGREMRHWGLRFIGPLLDARLVDMALRLPPDAHYRDGRSRVLLREALADLLPPVVRRRSDKATMEVLVHRGLREHRAGFLRALGQDSELADREWVLERPWREAIDSYLHGHDGLWWWLWPTLSMELWLRRAAERVPPIEGARL